MQLVLIPAAVVLASVAPPVPAHALYIVLCKVAYVDIATFPDESAVALLFTINVHAFEPRAIWPALEPLAMLLVLIPVAAEIATIIV